MSKRIIRLTESDLHRIVEESVKRTLNEVSFEKAQAAYLATQNPNRPISPAMQRRMANSSLARAQQSDNLKRGASNSFNREYGYNLKNVPYGSSDPDDVELADPSKPYYGGLNMYGPDRNYFQEYGGTLGDNGDPSPMYARETVQKKWGDRENSEGENVEMSLKDKFQNPGLYASIMRGRNAVNKAHQK